MKAKNFILGMIIVIMPFYLAVNILRVHYNSAGIDNFLGLNSILRLASEIDFSFAKTYVLIAEAGETWTEILNFNGTPNIFDVLKFLKFMWQAIVIPFQLVADLITGVYTCVMVFLKFVGFMPL